MARGTSGPAGEYDGTDGAGSGAIVGTSEPIDPRTIDGSAGGIGSGIGGGSGGSGSDEFDPRIHVDPDKRNADGSYTRKRGRKTGSAGAGNNPQKKAADLKGSIDSLAKTLVVVHLGLANITNTPELVIDADESKLLANATANLLEQFDLKPDPKIQALIGLVMAAGTVYGPRAFMIRQRKLQEAKEKKDSGTAGVYNADGTAAGMTSFSTI